jgi:type II secretion system protein H
MFTRRRGGFTIIEVVVVLLIIAVATAVTVPALQRQRTDSDMDAALRVLDTLFRTARDSAVRAGVPVTLAIDSATLRVWLIADGEDVAAPLELPPLPAGVRLQLGATRATFAFSPGGAVFADSLMLRDAMRNLTITVDPWTGHVVLR